MKSLIGLLVILAIGLPIIWYVEAKKHVVRNEPVIPVGDTTYYYFDSNYNIASLTLKKNIKVTWTGQIHNGVLDYGNKDAFKYRNKHKHGNKKSDSIHG